MKNKCYEIYVEVDNKHQIKIGATDSMDTADTIYAVCIHNMKNGSNTFRAQGHAGKITKVYIVRKEDDARFSFSLAEGFKEEFKGAA
jgi:hypothetical protein